MPRGKSTGILVTIQPSLPHTHFTRILQSLRGREVGRRYHGSQYTAEHAEAQRGLGTGRGHRVSVKDLSALNLKKQSFQGEEKKTGNSTMGEGNTEEVN